MKKANIRDVAEAAGVSTATVSHVINGTRKVGDLTTNRVLAAIADLQYSPNISARGFRTGRNKTIGFIIPDIQNLFFSALIDVIESNLAKNGYHLVIANTKESPERELEHIRYFSSSVVDGLIIASAVQDSSMLAEILPPSFPAVFIDRYLDNLNHDTITISSKRAVNDGVSYLINKGHRNIGYVSGTANISTSVERLKSYKETLEKHNIPVNENNIFCTAGRKTTAECASELVKNGCTAIVACNGMLTFEVQQYLWENGYNACSANEIEVLGFADAYMLKPGSHYISQPIDELGSMAVSQIIKRIENKNSAVKEIVLNSTFVE